MRKTKPVEEVFEFRRRLTLDQEKSKVGLAEVYEQEFLKMKEQKKDETNPEHDEIKELMNGLFRQLDALSNYHFMPRPAQPDLKIVKNLPTIAAEEVVPATVSDATMLAPEEVKVSYMPLLLNIIDTPPFCCDADLSISWLSEAERDCLLVFA